VSLVVAGEATARTAHRAASGPQANPSATLEECVTSLAQDERAATFAGEMAAIPGTVRMAMRIDVQEQAPEDFAFHTVSAPGLGVWRSSDAKVKIYKYLKEVTNLSAPATYRALVRFRWLGQHGRLLKRAERVTARCMQPTPPPVATAPQGGSASATTPSSVATAAPAG
jgi:hypothetical protein